MEGNTLLEVKDLSISFEGKGEEHVIYKNANLRIQKRETIGLLGPSGSGKSVLAKTVFNSTPRQLKHNSGIINFLDGTQKHQLFPAQKGKNHRIYGAHISMVFQEPGLAFNPVISIGKQLIEVVRKHQGIGKKEAAALIQEHLPKFDLAGKGYLAKYPHQLSGGQLQRLMILMATINKPDLLIADEPTTSLDTVTQKQVLDLLIGLREQGTALLVITHDLKVLRYLDARILEVKDQSLSPHIAGVHHEQKMAKTELGASNALDCQGMMVQFKELKAVDGVEFQLRHKEVLGIVGPSGCGKSTLSKAICELVPHKGSITPKYPTGKVQMIFQHPGSALDPIQKIGNAVNEALKVSGVKDKKVRRKKTEELFDQVGLPLKFYDYRPFQLSGGLKQRACIARALATSPEILICDEAVSSLDASLKWQIATLLVSLAQKQGMSLLFISHDIELVNKICHRVLVMDAGKVVQEFTTQNELPSSGSATLESLLEARI